MTDKLGSDNIADLLLPLATFFGLGLVSSDRKADLECRLNKLADNQQLANIDEPLLDLHRVLWYTEGDADRCLQAVFNFMEEVGKSAVISEPPTPSARTQPRDDVPKYSVKHWTRPLVGSSLRLLKTKVREYDRRFNLDPQCYYSKSLAFIQSSGVGKSRLADEYGGDVPMVTYVLRSALEDGYPPADRAIRTLLLATISREDEDILASPGSERQKDEKNVRSNNIWYHALALGLLQATFDCGGFSTDSLSLDL